MIDVENFIIIYSGVTYFKVLEAGELFIQDLLVVDL